MQRSDIAELRERTGAGIGECVNALKTCKGDVLLAAGYLKFYGCAINTYDMPHAEWAMRKAEAYKRDALAEIAARGNPSDS